MNALPTPSSPPGDATGTRKPRIAVVFGGRSSEHAISCVTAGSVLKAIDRDRYDVVPVGIATDGRWVLESGDPERLAITSADKLPEVDPTRSAVSLANGATSSQLMVSEPSSVPQTLGQVDAVFPLLHGPWGEDGTIQGLLELAGLPYVGAGVLASAVGMDKIAMKDMFRAYGLPIVDYVAVKRHEWRREPAAVERAVAQAIGFPCFAKPANLGSSVGISKVKAPEDLPAALALAAGYDRRILVERAVQGREVEVAVLGNDQPQASLPGEVCYAGEWYDYETKYGAGHTTFKVPAPLGPELTRRVRELALEAFRAIDCAGLARVDFFIEGESSVLVNEINTLPGFTASSAYPKLWEASGISYTELISRLIALALERR
jgi:D-alanine-D-alanine ligase